MLMNSALSYKQIANQLRSLQHTHSCVHSEVIGHSVMGKEILAIKLGEGKREIHYNAAIHANEWITAILLMRFIKDCALSLEGGEGFYKGSNIRALLQHKSIWLVPLLNPDGVELVLEGINNEHPFEKQLLEWNHNSRDFSSWKANIHGVDLNDQFPAQWEQERIRRNTLSPGPMNYSGPAPLCEPEARVIANFTLKHAFDLVLSLHTQGEEIYWNYRGLEPIEAADIADVFAKGSGYRAVKLEESDAGYKDWFIEHFRRPGFTIEAGYGINPLPIEQSDDMYEKVCKILLLGLEYNKV
jgi:g-D-glutamyl-meso-diaminopimelate peptidase